MRILIYGFEAFGGHEVNPTALLIDLLKNKDINYPQSLNVKSIVLPVTFDNLYEILK